MAKSGPFWIYNPSGEWSYGNSRLMENYFHVRFREHFFIRREFFVPFRVNSPAANKKLFWPYLFHLSSPEENPPPLRTPYLF